MRNVSTMPAGIFKKLRVANDDEVRVAAHHAHRVLERLALLHTRVLLVHVDDRAAEALRGRRERALGARARLVEHLGHHFAAQHPRQILLSEHECLEVVRHIEQLVQHVLLQAVHRDQVAAVERCERQIGACQCARVLQVLRHHRRGR